MLDIQNEMYIYENHKKISKMLNSAIERRKKLNMLIYAPYKYSSSIHQVVPK